MDSALHQVIIVLEKDPFVRHDVVMILETTLPNVHVVATADSDEATRVLRVRADVALAVLSISDAVPPPDLAALVDEVAACPVILLSDADPASLQNRAGWTYLAKPFSEETLAAAVRSTVRLPL